MELAITNKSLSGLGTSTFLGQQARTVLPCVLILNDSLNLRIYCVRSIVNRSMFVDRIGAIRAHPFLFSKFLLNALTALILLLRLLNILS